MCFCILALFFWYANRIISVPYTVICDLSGCAIFLPKLSHKRHDFRVAGEGKFLNFICVLIFLTPLLKYFLVKEEINEKLQTREPGLRRPYSDYGTDWTFRVLSPGRGKRFFFCFQNSVYRVCGPRSAIFHAYRGSVPGVTLTDLMFWCWPLICIYFRGQK